MPRSLLFPDLGRFDAGPSCGPTRRFGLPRQARATPALVASSPVDEDTALPCVSHVEFGLVSVTPGNHRALGKRMALRRATRSVARSSPPVTATGKPTRPRGLGESSMSRHRQSARRRTCTTNHDCETPRRMPAPSSPRSVPYRGSGPTLHPSSKSHARANVVPMRLEHTAVLPFHQDLAGLREHGFEMPRADREKRPRIPSGGQRGAHLLERRIRSLNKHRLNCPADLRPACPERWIRSRSR